VSGAGDDGGRVLVVNTGSSSLKLALLGPADQVAAEAEIESWDGDLGSGELRDFVAGLDRVDVVGHRVVHGGSRFTGPVLLDDQVMAALSELVSLAPLHQPRGLAGVRAVGALLPQVPQVACFDTAFHSGLPAAAATYPLPRAWRDRFGLRRYGFHGLSHGYAARRGAELTGADPAAARIVTCHLGGGASLAAVRGGQCRDTTMGFTPLEGLVMATRSGSVDPGMLIWLLQEDRLSLAELSDGLEHAAGLAGLAEIAHGTGDMREIHAAAAAGCGPARLAVDVYLHRLRAEIAAMTAALNGLDVLVFTGGVGEHDPQVRAAAVAGLAFLGVAADEERNAAARSDADITAPGAAVRTVVVTAREDIEIARQARSVLAGGDAGAACVRGGVCPGRRESGAA